MKVKKSCHSRLTFCILGVLYCLPVISVESAEQDFLFLEMERSLREEPSSAKTPARLFALGEYLFDMGHFEKAENYFRRVEEKPLSETQATLARVYLAEIARLRSPEIESSELLNLKESLSSQKFFTMSGKTKKQRWESPLKNHYEIEEFVDRLEVRRNGVLFYAVRLP